MSLKAWCVNKAKKEQSFLLTAPEWIKLNGLIKTIWWPASKLVSSERICKKNSLSSEYAAATNQIQLNSLLLEVGLVLEPQVWRKIDMAILMILLWELKLPHQSVLSKEIKNLLESVQVLIFMNSFSDMKETLVSSLKLSSSLDQFLNAESMNQLFSMTLKSEPNLCMKVIFLSNLVSQSKVWPASIRLVDNQQFVFGMSLKT